MRPRSCPSVVPVALLLAFAACASSFGQLLVETFPCTVRITGVSVSGAVQYEFIRHQAGACGNPFAGPMQSLGVTGSPLIELTMQPAFSGLYRMRALNAEGAVVATTDSPYVQHVAAGTPFVDASVASLQGFLGETIVVSAGAVPSGSTVAWLRNGKPAGNLSGPTFSLQLGAVDDGTVYRAVVTNGCGSSLGGERAIDVLPLPPSGLLEWRVARIVQSVTGSIPGSQCGCLTGPTTTTVSNYPAGMTAGSSGFSASVGSGGGSGWGTGSASATFSFRVTSPCLATFSGTNSPAQTACYGFTCGSLGGALGGPRSVSFPTAAGTWGPIVVDLPVGEYTVTRNASGGSICPYSSCSGCSASGASINASFAPLPTTCPADLDANGFVGGGDLTQVLGYWGDCTGCAADLDRSGTVGAEDLAIVLSRWGTECVPWATIIALEPTAAEIPSAELRSAIGATGLPWRVRDAATQIEMLLVPPGEFQMGCSAAVQHPCEASELPVRTVTITRPYYLSRYEITQAQWVAAMGSNPSFFRPPSYTNVPSRPVESVSWAQATAFCTLRGFRLPTEAEWEFAYRASTTTAYHRAPSFPSGFDDAQHANTIAWLWPNSSERTQAVGALAPNGLGFHDMAGNVSELVADWFDPAYYAIAPTVDPLGPASSPTGTRVIRGGSWADDASRARASARSNLLFGAMEDVGFRVARNP